MGQRAWPETGPRMAEPPEGPTRHRGEPFSLSCFRQVMRLQLDPRSEVLAPEPKRRLAHMGYIRDYQFFAFPLLAFVVLAGLLYAIRNLSWEQSSHVASTVSAFAVILALVLAGFEYLLHHQGDQDRKKQAVLDIQRVTIGLERLDKAYATLFDFDPDEVLRLDPKTFDERVASLSDVFWAIGGCAAAKQ